MTITAKTYETLEVTEPEDGILMVRFNRPAVANAINTRMGHELLSVWDGLNAAPGHCSAVVLVGAGTRAFCAGGDLKERNGMSDAEWHAQHLVFERMVRAFLAVPMPIIGAVNGAAYGGGCEFALCCDFLYASSSARFALTETTLGIIPGSGGTQMLPRAVGARRAKELIYSGRPFSAEEAQAWGMVNQVVPPDQLLAETLAAARAIAANAPLAVRQAKHAIDTGLQLDLRSGLMFEIEAYSRLPATEDRREGVRAFNEGRKPVFRGV